MNIDQIHIGKEIYAIIKEKGISVTDFAKQIPCNRQNVYNIFTRKSMDIALLIKISKILKYDFIINVYYKKRKKKKGENEE